MGRTNKERILDYLWTMAPGYATNGQIREATGIRSRQGLLSYDLDTANMCLDRFGSDRKLTEQWRLVHLPRPHMLVPLKTKDTTWILTHTW